MSDPKIVMTLMVRDEADIIAAMVEHHLAQGVDLIIATDNGSIDGTRDILAAYAETGRLELHDYLTHDKNQSAVVTEMAARAATEHGATWVINADADEFFLPVDPALTLRDALRHIPTGIGAFEAKVVNFTGAPAKSGGALTRLVRRDQRPEESLMETVALHAHPSSDMIHVGRADVQVVQGNHSVNIPSMGEPPKGFAIEVHHVPWRTYEQYSTKIMNTGRSYDANPTLNPSPRHHGMRDYRLWKAGLLEHLYVVRHPGDDPGPSFPLDDRVVRGLLRSVDTGTALRPDLLAPSLSMEWEEYTAEERATARQIADLVIPLEVEHLAASTKWRDLYRGEAAARRRDLAEKDRAVALADRLQRRPEARLRSLVGRVVRAPRALARRVLARI
ncbi:glycosyltransferase family 2 protein [Microbacterium sp.]|uniref:glycosyltransferase family 2 protein n=1 Tax=Microbacterium sp. TaxID=51671 RepID=UPI0035AF2346